MDKRNEATWLKILEKKENHYKLREKLVIEKVKKEIIEGIEKAIIERLPAFPKNNKTLDVKLFSARDIQDILKEALISSK